MSNVIVQGRIGRVSSKPFKDNRTGEDILLHSFQLEGKTTWYRTGQRPIPAGVGQDVRFIADDVKVDMGTFEVAQSAVAAAPSVAQAVTAQTSAPPTPHASTAETRKASVERTAHTAGSRDEYWANKEARDVAKDARFQAVNEPRMALSIATEAAAALVSSAIAKDALSFGNASKAKKLGLLASYTKELALDLASFINDAPNQLANYKSAGSQSVANVEEASAEAQE